MITASLLSGDLAPVEVSFGQPSYNLTEKSGSVEVCVVATFNTSTSPINVTVSESSDTAQGEKRVSFHGETIRQRVN